MVIIQIFLPFLCFLSSSASQLEGSCNFADTICASERLDSGVFSHLVNLLPADIARNPDTTRYIYIYTSMHWQNKEPFAKAVYASTIAEKEGSCEKFPLVWLHKLDCGR